MDNESFFFKIVIVIIFIIIAGAVLANIIYFGDVSKGQCANITADTGNTMMWFNIVLFIIIFIVFIWSVIRLFFNKKTKKVKIQESKEAYNKEVPDKSELKKQPTMGPPPAGQPTMGPPPAGPPPAKRY